MYELSHQPSVPPPKEDFVLQMQQALKQQSLGMMQQPYPEMAVHPAAMAGFSLMTTAGGPVYFNPGGQQFPQEMFAYPSGPLISGYPPFGQFGPQVVQQQSTIEHYRPSGDHPVEISRLSETQSDVQTTEAPSGKESRE